MQVTYHNPESTLKEQLSNLLREAKENENIHQKFQALEMRVMNAESLRELINSVLSETRLTLNLDVITLALFDPEHVAKNILVNEQMTLKELQGLVLVEDQFELQQIFCDDVKPVFGSLYSKDYEALFSREQKRHGSVVLLPLVRNQCLIGCLNLGSFNPRRFTDGLATDFLQRYANIVAVCLENAIRFDRLKQLSLTDVLTGVNNRRSFDQRLHEELSRAERDQSSLSCLFIDIDLFKSINDKHGHSVGDKILKDTASLIRLRLRQSDFLARYGGEEFTVLLPNTTLKQATSLAERVRKAIASAPFQIGKNNTVNVTVSIGVASVKGSQLDRNSSQQAHDKMLKQADKALYQAKAEGRNCVIQSK